jgi:hypothetical protein
MSIDVLMSAAPAPWRERTPVPYPLAKGDADILRLRAAAVPDHVMHAIGICTQNNDLDGADAHNRDLLDDAIAEGLEDGIGCAMVHLDRDWLIGGGMDAGDGGLWSERISALALSGITELALDADARAVAPSVVQAREIVTRPATWSHARAYLRDLLADLGAAPEQSTTAIDAAIALGTERTEVLVDLVAVTIRSRTVCSLV